MKHTGLLGHLQRPKDYIAGASTGIPDDIVLPSGDWREFISEPHEMQKRFGKDFMTCTAFASTDAIEALMFMLFGERVNYSERALSILAKNTRKGNYLVIVAEAIRTYGLMRESLLPWTEAQDTFEKYNSWTPQEEDVCRKAGAEWLKEYEFGYEFIYDDWGKGMRWALQRSPLFAAGLYPSESGKVNGIYTTELPGSSKTTHAFVLLNQTEEGYKDIDDSYVTQLKRLDTDFRVPIALRFWIKKRADIIKPPMQIPSNSLVIVTDNGERLGYIGGDTIIKDDAGKLLLEFTARNAKDGLSRPFPVIHVVASDVAHLRRINLKGDGV